jgi:hypothetical protein
MDSGLPRADEIISLNEAEALMQANLNSESNKVVNKIGTALDKKITELFDFGMRQYYIDTITDFIKKELIDSTTTKQINKILALQTPAFKYNNEGKNTQPQTIIGRKNSSQSDSLKTQPKIIGRTPQPDSPQKPFFGSGRTSSSTRKRAKKGKRFNKTQKQLGGDYGLLTGVIKGPMARLEKVVKNKLSTYHIENAIGTGFYRAMGQAAFDENTLNLEVDKMLEEQLKTSKPGEFKNALVQARCPNR